MEILVVILAAALPAAGWLARGLWYRIRRDYAAKVDVGMMIGPACRRQKPSEALDERGRPRTGNLDADDMGSALAAGVSVLREFAGSDPPADPERPLPLNPAGVERLIFGRR